MATITQYHDLPEVYMNVVDLPHKDQYQLIYDYTQNGIRRNLYVLKNWRLEKPKPFISVPEYVRLSSDQKESYGTILRHGGDYLYYRVERYAGYSIKQNPPILLNQEHVQGILMRKKGLASISPQTVLTGDADILKKAQPQVLRTPQNTPVLTQETAGPYYSQKQIKGPLQLGVMVALANRHPFHQIIRNFGVTASLIRSTRVDGKNVDQFVITVNNLSPQQVKSLTNALKPLTFDIRVVQPNVVAPPDFYRPQRNVWSIPTGNL